MFSRPELRSNVEVPLDLLRWTETRWRDFAEGEVGGEGCLRGGLGGISKNGGRGGRMVAGVMDEVEAVSAVEDETVDGMGAGSAEVERLAGRR